MRAAASATQTAGVEPSKRRSTYAACLGLICMSVREMLGGPPRPGSWTFLIVFFKDNLCCSLSKPSLQQGATKHTAGCLRMIVIKLLTRDSVLSPYEEEPSQNYQRVFNSLSTHIYIYTYMYICIHEHVYVYIYAIYTAHKSYDALCLQSEITTRNECCGPGHALEAPCMLLPGVSEETRWHGDHPRLGR